MELIIFLKAAGNLLFAGLLLFAICFWGLFCGVVYTLLSFIKQEYPSKIKTESKLNRSIPTSNRIIV
ncbi:hypothetical protein CLV98_10739 [Dyadobacter jejuensis]|uniref:Uncharacterized protein n=1 Tax=Dyadobacter jejuensis TaxID=1082580 RepID=A0A316AI02_9BACT|nr:hypothetical protein CLV98_10739 [Dyadobacter jejuensis]